MCLLLLDKLKIVLSNIFSPGTSAHKAKWAQMHKIWENRPEALRVDEPGENTRYTPSLRGRGWGENCYRGCGDLNFTRTGWVIKQAALKTEGQGLWVCRVFPWATLRILGSALMLTKDLVGVFPSENSWLFFPTLYSFVKPNQGDSSSFGLKNRPK